MGRGILLSYQFVQHLATFPMLYFFSKVAKSGFIRDKIMSSRYLGRILSFASGMTLEVFMVNNSIDSFKFGPFPFNIIFLLLLNLVLGLLIFYCAKYVREILESDRLAVSRR